MVRVSAGWGAVALLSLLALAWLAPDGLLLLAFLAVVIASHEAGHLLVARRAGMAPTEYFWGFGPEVISFQRGGCRYGLRVLFVGGYVKIEGMTPSAGIPPGFDEAGTFRAASHRGRLATILAGPAVNLVTAAGAFAVAGLLGGQALVPAVVGGVSDLGYIVTGTADALRVWVSNLGDYVASVADRSGSTAAPVRFMSPVSQAEVSRWAVDNGPASTLRWFGVLSAAVGAVNLLPLPPLDGAHALAAAVEGVVQRLLPGRAFRLDVGRLTVVAYLTIVALVLLSLSALVLDLRDVV
jgi:membrane-associated protease RseP (regulator of RpoE activity)